MQEPRLLRTILVILSTPCPQILDIWYEKIAEALRAEGLHVKKMADFKEKVIST